MKTTYIVKHWDGRWKYYCNGGCWRLCPRHARRFDNEDGARLKAARIGLSVRIVPYQDAVREMEKRNA